MRTIIMGILAIILSVGFSLMAAAQSDSSALNDSTAAWRVNYISDNGSGGTWFTQDNYRYTFDGDTLINAMIYHKLYKGGHYYEVDFYGGGSFNHRYYSHEYAGAIREADAKWYYHGSSDYLPGQESLLYDFTLNVGDPLPVSYNNPYSNLTVSAIDTVVVNNIERRRYILEGQMGPGATYVIEGLGSDVGLIEPMQQFEQIWYLVCYAEDGVPAWPESGSDCDLNVSAQLINTTHDQLISVSPNPFISTTMLRFPVVQQSGFLRISDMQGRVVWQYMLTSGQSDLEIQPELNDGIYLLGIYTPTQILIRKIAVH